MILPQAESIILCLKYELLAKNGQRGRTNLLILLSEFARQTESGQMADQPSGNKSATNTRRGKEADLGLKATTASALAANGYFCRVDVSLSAVNGGEINSSDAADVDVLAVRHDVTFHSHVMAVTCKVSGERSSSVAREIFRLRGVLDHLDAQQGIILLPKKSADRHLRDLGQKLRILVLTGSDVARWIEALERGKATPGGVNERTLRDCDEMLGKAGKSSLKDYLRTDYWFYRDFRNIQNLTGHLRRMSGSLTGAEPWHGLLYLEAAAHFSLSLLELCRTIQSQGIIAIKDVTAEYLFGGATSFKARRDLYTKVQHLLTATGALLQGGPELPPLEPQYTSRLAELAFRFLERPGAAMNVPQTLQDSIWRSLGSGTHQTEDSVITPYTEKLALDLIDFLKSASQTSWAPRL